MKAFWNDAEGLSLLEFIAIWVMVLWGFCMVVVAIMAFILFTKEQEMSQWWLEYINVFADVPVAVVIGLYGQGAFSKFGESIAGLREFREVEKPSEDTGDEFRG